jgi:hypothetical protein
MSDEPVMKFYDAAGRPVSDEAKAVVQYLSDDPNRPDAAGVPPEVGVTRTPPEATVIKVTPETRRVSAPRPKVGKGPR